jgi:peptide deformylase
MAIQPILRLGDPRLFRTAKPVEQFNTPDLDALVANMFETMASADGAGLAAPQIAVNLRVVIFGFEKNTRYPTADAIPQTVLINPQVTPLNDEMENGWEGCLSVPGMRGLVPRHTKIRYTGYDASGRSIDVIAEGFHARVVQHECDHLDGIIYTQRLCDPRKFGFIEELASSGELNSGVCSTQ